MEHPEPTPSAARPHPLVVPASAALLALVTFWCWAPVLSLPLSGEEYAIFARMKDGGAVAEHLFRPWLDLLLGPLHGIFGVETAVPYHLASIGLHLGCAVLLLLLALRLTASPMLALTAALWFAIGAGATDAVAWVAAVNRPLSLFGALLLWLGLHGFCLEGRRRDATLILVGLALQFGTNEEVYGPALLACPWLLYLAREDPARRQRVLGLVVVLVAALVAHFLIYRLGYAPDETEGTAYHLNVDGLKQSVHARQAALLAGWGLPPFTVWVLPIGALVVWFLSNTRSALFGLSMAVASLVPFALSDPNPYRFYPTQAALALILICGAGSFVQGPQQDRHGTIFALGLTLLGMFCAAGPRTERIERWRTALAEVRACDEALRSRPTLMNGELPPLANLEATTASLLAYHFGVPPATARSIGFLDTPHGFVRPEGAPEGPWFGRRCEGSFGWIEPATYFRERPELPVLKLYTRLERAEDLAAARTALADGSVDPVQTGLVERELEGWVDGDGGEGLGVFLAEPLQLVSPNLDAPVVARMRVRVSVPREAVLAVHQKELYEGLWRCPPDWALQAGLERVRRARLRAKRTEGAGELETFAVNAFGLGVRVPPGETELELEFWFVPLSELR